MKKEIEKNYMLHLCCILSYPNKNLREDVSIHQTNLKYCGKSPNIRFLPYFRIL